MAAYKAGNVKKGGKKGPGRRAKAARKGAASSGGGPGRLSGSRAQYVRRRRKSAGS